MILTFATVERAKVFVSAIPLPLSQGKQQNKIKSDKSRSSESALSKKLHVLISSKTLELKTLTVAQQGHIQHTRARSGHLFS